MSDPTARATGDLDRRPIARVLSIVIALFLAALEVQRAIAGHEPIWTQVLVFTAMAAWIAATLAPASPPRLLRDVILGIALVAGSFAACASDGVGFAPAVASVLGVIGRPARPVWLGGSAAVLSLLLVGVGALLVPDRPQVLLALLAVLIIAVLLGLSRRQFRAAQAQSRLLLEERIVVEQERAEVAALAERSRIARDIHDVLAHSLGGLVLQLDATEALLESGRTDEAARRVIAARGLAADGLVEARRAVDALRDPEASADPAQAIEQLIRTHESLGALAELRQAGEPRALTPEAAGALRRAAQEVLSNARRHAPGMATRLTLTWTPGDVALRASTALTPVAVAASPGGGRGLAGLAERMAALGGSATAGIQDRAFVVEAHLPRRADA